VGSYLPGEQTKMETPKPFQSKEMKDLKQQIKAVLSEQKALQKLLREQAQKVIDGRFEVELLDKLEQLENKEVELETNHIVLRQAWLEATQKERRECLLEAQSKLGSNSIYKSVSPRALDQLSSRIFGKSSRSVLKSINPFTDQEQCVPTQSPLFFFIRFNFSSNHSTDRRFPPPPI